MFKDTSDYIKGAIFINFVSFITLPIYTRYLTPEDFGIIALSFIFGQITATIFSFGLSNATTRFFFEYKEKDQLDKFKSLKYDKPYISSCRIYFNWFTYLSIFKKFFNFNF